MSKKIRVILFAGLLITMSLANVLKPQVIFSSSENRYLKTFPEFTWDRFKDGSFNKEIDEFTNDQFLYRDTWVSLKSSLEILSGKLDNGRAYFGKGGYLFSIDDVFSQERYESNMNYINQFRLANKDIEMDFLLVPSKHSAMGQYLPKDAPHLDEVALFNKINSDLGGATLTNLFESFQGEEDIYFKTDHHWNAEGALLAYQAYNPDTALDMTSLKEEVLSNSFYGTDYRKVNAKKYRPDPFTIITNDKIANLKMTKEGQDKPLSLFDKTKLETSDMYAYYQGGNQGVTRIQGNAGNGKRILVIKDSFANSMVQYLTYDYDEIVMVDLRHYNGSVSAILNSQSFDRVLFNYNIQTLVQDPTVSKLRN